MNVYNHKKPAKLLRYQYTYRNGPQLTIVERDTTMAFKEDFENWTLKEADISNIKDDAVFYFTKQSKFPRFKLSNTAYKRCIKHEKADYIVVPRITLPHVQYVDTVIETENFYYISWYKLNLVEFESLLNIHSSQYKVKHNVPIYDNLSDSDITLLGIQSGKINKQCITDATLNKLIDSKNQVLTTDDIDQIKTMLESSDEETQALGLKLLANYNIDETRCAVKYLLSITSNFWKYNSYKNNVSIKNMLNNLVFYYGNTHPINALRSCQNNDRPISEVDKKLMQYMISNCIPQYFEYNLHSDFEILNKFGIKCKLDFVIDE